jgi:MSHA biogenesis protein MshP
MSATSPKRTRGFAAITAIFIVIVLAGMGIVLATISSGQQRSSTFDQTGVKAYQATRAGIEFAVFNAAVNSSCAASNTIVLSGALTGYSVTTACTSTSHTEATTAITTYDITATGCNRASCPGTPDATYVERQLRVTVGSS